MKFKDYKIDNRIVQNLDRLGFRRPTDIQYKSIPSILKGEDVLAIAQTGTGKTAAFAIPIIDKLLKIKKKRKRKDGIKCLVMVPTHELALQIAEVLNTIAKGTGVRTISIFGGVDQDPQIKKLDKGADILVATPGRMFDLRSQGYLKLHRVEVLVLDEADHMLDMGFIKDIEDVLHYLPKRRQTLFFSATINKKIKKTAYSIVRQTAIRIQISPKNPVARNVDHQVAFVKMDDKRFFLERLYNEHPEFKILVFVRTKVRAERVCSAMERVGIEALTIHGDKSHKSRIEVLNKFKEGTVRMLIGTDVTARGIDIPDVDYVVNYDMPTPSENYVHRVGRTGRGRKKGMAISFCSEHEKEILQDIESFLGAKIKILYIDEDAYEQTLDITEDTKGVNWKKMIELELKKAEEEKENAPNKPFKKGRK